MNSTREQRERFYASINKALSKPGDPIRQGRADGGPRRSRADAKIEIVPQGNYHVARMGVVTLGSIHPNPDGLRASVLWKADLPGARPVPQPAATFEKAEGALRHFIREWFKACRHPIVGEG